MAWHWHFLPAALLVGSFADLQDSTADLHDPLHQLYENMRALAATVDSAHAPRVGSLEQFRFAQAYSDGMVLQREPLPASIWGYAVPGAPVTLAIIDEAIAAGAIVTSATVATSESGLWRVVLPPRPASLRPVTVVAMTSGSNISLKNVLFGDVWLCSGQSNMAFSLGTPLVDPDAEAKIAKAYATDPGASPEGNYIDTATALRLASGYSAVRYMVVGNKHDCPAPIADWYPSGTNDTRLSLAQPWRQLSPNRSANPADVMGGGISATCWFFGTELHDVLKVPIGLIHTSYGGSAIEDWMSKQTLGDGTMGPCPGPIVGSMGVPSQQYNGQLRPLLNTTIKGAIWYQGESNAGQDALYACRFEQMMNQWRHEWHEGTGGATDPRFPIGFVQIGPNTSPNHDELSFKIRMGQTADYGYAPNPRWPHTFMATAFDLANPPDTKCFWGCIHIFNKQAVGHRLAVAARNLVYKEASLVYSGPRLVSATVDASGSAAHLVYGIGTEGLGLALRGSHGFEVCCRTALSCQWLPANITSNTKTSIDIAVTAQCFGITQVRYAHFDMPSIFYGTAPCVFNGEGLPATPGIYNVTAADAIVLVV